MNPHPQGDHNTLAAIARRAMIEQGLEPDFSPEAKEELSAIHGAASIAGGDDKLRDLRGLLWASIDNDDSRDLDQLTVAESLDGGRVRILVAVADVDALVHRGSALDAHASHNTTSVYTPAAIFPMLPEALSTGLTSLNPGEDRVAIVMDMVFEEDGSQVSSDIYRAAVHNRAKLAYASVAAWLDGKAAAPQPIAKIAGLDENLRVQDRMAQKLAALRHTRGALSLETIEAKVVFEDGAISDLVPDERNRAKQLIEDFMIAANGVSAFYLQSKGFPSLRRVLKVSERWDRIAQLASQCGDSLPATADAKALESFLDRRNEADPLGFPDLSLAVVKLMGRGEYVLNLQGRDSTGHFGLAVKDYTHSTAPNRRFPDLVTHRLLKAAMSGKPLPYSIGELDEIAQNCTTREDDAAKVERRVRKSAAALFLSSRIGENFDAIVTGASAKGTWVRIFRPASEGRLVRDFKGLDVGDRVHVKLTHTDVQRGFIDFVRG